jgi:Spy/CpxP family protein refolding chaperone
MIQTSKKKRITLIGLGTLTALLFLVLPSFGQPGFGGHRGMRPPGERPEFLKALFPPELVMRHQTAIALTDEQRAAITEAIKTTQNDTVEIQWQLQAEQEKLSKLLGAARIDEEEALAQVTVLMSVEQKMKKEHLGLLIRIKNQLTPEQQEQLRGLRKNRRKRPPPSQ